MKRLALALCCIALAAVADEPVKPAQETPPATDTVYVETPKDTTALVEAARAAKAKRKQSTGKRKVITNADVKRSKGKLQEYTPPELPANSEMTVTPSLMERHETNRKARIAAEERLAVAQKKAAELEKELSGLELSFYEENDPNYRDGVIQKRFTQTKRQLDEARTELANARDALAAIESAPKP